jgi:hypothetical protein
MYAVLEGCGGAVRWPTGCQAQVHDGGWAAADEGGQRVEDPQVTAGEALRQLANRRRTVGNKGQDVGDDLIGHARSPVGFSEVSYARGHSLC